MYAMKNTGMRMRKEEVERQLQIHGRTMYARSPVGECNVLHFRAMSMSNIIILIVPKRINARNLRQLRRAKTNIEFQREHMRGIALDPFGINIGRECIEQITLESNTRFNTAVCEVWEVVSWI